MDTNTYVLISSNIIAALLALAGLYYKDRADQRRIDSQNQKLDRNADKSDVAATEAKKAYTEANSLNAKIAQVADVKQTVDAVHDRVLSIESRIDGVTHTPKVEGDTA